MLLVENGLIDPAAKFELMDGAVIHVSPKGRHHEIMRERIELWLDQAWRKPFNVLREHTLTLDTGTLVEPDFLLYDAARRIADAPLAGADIRLVIEVADSSWRYDVEAKAPKYARFGVAEYWVVHAMRPNMHVFRTPCADGYASVADIGADQAVAPQCAPDAVLSRTG